jgi:flagellin-specific chaperone FliS
MNTKRDVVILFVGIVIMAFAIQGIQSYFLKRYSLRRLEYKVEHVIELIQDMKDLDEDTSPFYVQELTSESNYIVSSIVESKSQRAIETLNEVLVELRSITH